MVIGNKMLNGSGLVLYGWSLVQIQEFGFRNLGYIFWEFYFQNDLDELVLFL